MSKISIIIPVYNVGKFLDKTLNSLINQTYKNIEIICVNDGSTDNSLEILQKFTEKDKRIKVLTQPNSGPATARNNGLENMTGKYVMFCDADDWFEPTMAEEMINAIEENNADFVVCDTNVVDEFEGIDRCDSRNGYKISYEGLKKFNSFQEIQNVSFTLWNKIFKKSIIDKHNISFPDGNYYYEDTAFTFQYLLASNHAFFINKKLYNYFRRDEGSLMQHYSAVLKNPFGRAGLLHFIYGKLKENKVIEQKWDSFAFFYKKQFEFGHKVSAIETKKQLVLNELKWLDSIKAHLSSVCINELEDYVKLIHLSYVSTFEKKKFKYKILSKITFGKIRKKYTEKYKTIKGLK